MIRPIFSVIVLAFSLIFVFVYGMEKWTLVQEHLTNLVTLDETLKKSEHIKKLIAETGENLKAVPKENLDRFAVFLPEKIDDIRLANTIQHIGYSNNLLLEGIKVEKSATSSAAGDTASKSSVSDKKYKATKVTFALSASYDAFLLFLDDLEKSLGLINVTSLSFTSIGDGGSTTSKKVGPPLYHFVVGMETYSLQ